MMGYCSLTHPITLINRKGPEFPLLGCASCSVSALRLRFLFHIQNVPPDRAKFLFKVRLGERAIAVGQLQGDICPVLYSERVEHGRKHDALLHGHMLPLVVDEVANDVVYALSQEILVAQDELDRLSDSAQTYRAHSMFSFEIADSCRCDRVARLELLDDNI